jgi:hypothetical protein
LRLRLRLSLHLFQLKVRKFQFRKLLQATGPALARVLPATTSPRLILFGVARSGEVKREAVMWIAVGDAAWISGKQEPVLRPLRFAVHDHFYAISTGSH